MRRFIPLTLILLTMCLAACAAGSNDYVGTMAEAVMRSPAGFWLGLWQGFIIPLTFIISLFTENVNIYEVHNNGGWYDFGFVLGAGALASVLGD